MRFMNLTTPSNQTARQGLRNSIFSQRRSINELERAALKLGIKAPQEGLEQATDTLSLTEAKLREAETVEFGSQMTPAEREASDGVSKYAYKSQAETVTRRVDQAEELLMGIDGKRRDNDDDPGQVSGDSGTKWLTRLGNGLKDGPAGYPWNLSVYRAEGVAGSKNGVEYVGATVHMSSDNVRWVGRVRDQESGREILLDMGGRKGAFNHATVGYEFTPDGNLITYNRNEVRALKITDVLGPDFQPFAYTGQK